MKDVQSTGFSRKKPLAVMMSARANVFYLQYAKVCLDGDRVVYWQRGVDIDEMYNIPDKNTAFLLLGKGTSITDAAVRALSESGVVIGFAGTGGSPFFASASPVFLETQSEYRPTEYMQSWVIMWIDEAKRLQVAKEFLRIRMDLTQKFWAKIYPEVSIPEKLINKFTSDISTSVDTMNLLISEADWAKSLYALLARQFGMSKFSRESGGSDNQEDESIKLTNSLLDHGNYIAYGYAAAALTTLGISYAFPVLHGKTRRGALVFDVADLIKDALVMPLAFESGKKNLKNRDFREILISRCWDYQVLDTLIETIKKASKNNCS